VKMDILPVSEGMNDVVSPLLILSLLLSDDMENGKLRCERCVMMGLERV